MSVPGPVAVATSSEASPEESAALRPAGAPVAPVVVPDFATPPEGAAGAEEVAALAGWTGDGAGRAAAGRADTGRAGTVAAEDAGRSAVDGSSRRASRRSLRSSSAVEVDGRGAGVRTARRSGAAAEASSSKLGPSSIGSGAAEMAAGGRTEGAEETEDAVDMALAKEA